jgi:two-component system sensor histidine kinase/response regulator
MDIRMPVLNGIESAKKIREMERRDAKTIPIIAMTANAFSEEREEALEAGINDYLTKPIDAEVMYACLRNYMRR